MGTPLSGFARRFVGADGEPGIEGATGATGAAGEAANLTGPITSVGAATAIASQTGTGTTFAMQTAPTFITKITTPLVVGGTAVGSKIEYRSTTGAGTTTGQAHSFTGGTDGATSIVSMLNNGAVGIGHAGSTNVSLRIDKNITGSTTYYGQYTQAEIKSDVTTLVTTYSSNLQTEAAAFTLTDLRHFGVTCAILGAGSAITNQYGFAITNDLTTATNNYGFYGIVSSGANKWNLYMVGNASNYLAGNTGIGQTSFGSDATKTLALGTGVAPSTSPVDAFQLYSADQASGNACLFTRTENGAVVKIYQETTGVTSSTFVSNAGTAITSTDTFDGYTLAKVVKALRNQGLLA